jgi:hypothetical protein
MSEKARNVVSSLSASRLYNCPSDDERRSVNPSIE